jgi:long-chain fatty acid transport protein
MYPGAADGPARWHAYHASTMSIYGTLGIAYRIGPLALGVTGNLIYTTLQYNRAQNPGGGAGINDLTHEGRSYLDAHAINGSFGAGAMLEAIPDELWFGLSYQAQPGLGDMSLNGTLEVDPTLNVPGDSLKRTVTFHQALPDVIRAGIKYRPSRQLELRVAGDRTRWSVVKTQCVGLENQPCTVLASGDPAPGSGAIVNFRRNWNDTWGVRGGASYWFGTALETFAGVGYETAATPDSTLDPVLADANNLALALGARLGIARSWFIALSYTHLQFMNRDTTGRSTLADPTVGAITRRPDGGGLYTQWVGVIDANLTKTF